MTLPIPSIEERLYSERLFSLIKNEIKFCQDLISFARYMELALYTPGLGYYSSDITKFGCGGDFVTAPELSPLFAQTLATQVAQILDKGLPHILELGAGTGKFAADLLTELEYRQKLPEKYFILEVSGNLQQRQRQKIERQAPHLITKVEWLTTLPKNFQGMIIANEVLDALPTQIVHWTQKGIFERGVAFSEGKFHWQEQPAPNELLKAASKIQVPDDYVSEINLAALGLIHSLSEILQRGAILIIDYGFPASEYYHPQRNTGTLMCHYRHYAHADPFYFPGLQDITSHVNFTALAEAAEHSGLAVVGYTTQAQFLINCGITDILQRVPAEDVKNYLPLAGAAQKLLNPAEMGELFKVMMLAKHIDLMAVGFARGDKKHKHYTLKDHQQSFQHSRLGWFLAQQS